jgi:putative DNA primase/helicase
LGLQLGRFSCWCPKAIATIKHLPETLQDRCIVIHMHRKTANEKCDRLSLLNAGDLRRKCARFVLDHAPDIARARPAVPEDLNDRAADIWEPLLALADLAGGDWPEKARKAALGLTARAQEDSPIGALLLDIMILLLQPACAQGNGGMNGSAGVRIFSRDLVVALNNCTDRPWMVLRRAKDVTERWLSQQLSPYGIRPRTVWIAGTSAKGYLEGDFKEAFRRYIPKAAVQALLEESRAADREKDKIEARQQAVAPAPILPTA